MSELRNLVSEVEIQRLVVADSFVEVNTKRKPTLVTYGRPINGKYELLFAHAIKLISNISDLDLSCKRN